VFPRPPILGRFNLIPTNPPVQRQNLCRGELFFSPFFRFSSLIDCCTFSRVSCLTPPQKATVLTALSGAFFHNIHSGVPCSQLVRPPPKAPKPHGLKAPPTLAPPPFFSRDILFFFPPASLKSHGSAPRSPVFAPTLLR